MKTYTLAAMAIVIALFAGAIQPATSAVEKPRIEVCFVLDTTGSMGGLIEGAKQKIWSIANQMIGAQPTPELKIALIGYRDRSDEYVTKLFDLTDDIDSVHEKLSGFQAGGGGDGPESVNQALDEAVNKISWSQDRRVLKIIFLVGDFPPHMDYQDDVKYPVTCRKAVQRDLMINTVQCGNERSTTPIWQEIAKFSEGTYSAIGQTGDMVAIATPLDAEISRLNVSIGNTLIAYGSEREQQSMFMKQKAAEAAPAAVAADRLKYNIHTNKSVQGKGELLDAVNRGDVKLAEIKKEELPAELRKLNKNELKTYVDKKLTERTELQNKLKDLLAKRDAYIQAEKKRLQGGRKDAFDEKVAETIRLQAARKGIVYSK